MVAELPVLDLTKVWAGLFWTEGIESMAQITMTNKALGGGFC